MISAENSKLVVLSEEITRTMRYSTDDIAAFARMSFDNNPLHLDERAAKRGRFGRIIASGQQTAAVLMGMLASHFSRDTDGEMRQMLCLNMNFSFKSPVFAEQDVNLRWRVSTAAWSQSLGGVLAHLDGHAWVVPGSPVVIARGTILVSRVVA